MQLHALLILAGVSLAATTGCKSQVEKCMDTTNETYEREVAACKDDACKQQAEKSKLEFYESCKNLK